MPEQSNIDYQLLPEVPSMMDSSENECSNLTFDENEQKIVNATIAAFQTGSLTPLIKEELRCTIQSRRLAEGKGEMTVEFKKPPKRKNMTEDERMRALKRRHQNREAAQRFRQKQKDTSDYLSDKIARLQRNSDSLVKCLDDLRKEKDELQDMLKAHLSICTRTTIPLPVVDNVEVDTILQQFDFTPDQIELYSTSESIADSESPVSPVTPDIFPETFPEAETVHVIEPNDELFQMLESSKGFCYPEEVVKCEGSVEVAYDVPSEVCYEEVITANGDLYFSEDKQRLDSCSSVETSYDSCISDTTSLSDSTTDLRHSISSAYSRVHMDSCSSSDTFETRYLNQEFLLSEEEIS